MDAARELVAWDCRACRARQLASSRPLGCGQCGSTNSFTASPSPIATPRKRPAFPWKASKTPADASVAANDESPGPPSENASEAIYDPAPRRWAWASEVQAEHVERAPSGWEPWERVTGGLPRTKITLVGGPRGTGKTRALVRVAGGIARALGRPVIYQTPPGEMTAAGVRAIAEAIGFGRELGRMALLERAELEELEELAREIRPAAVFVDAFKVATRGGLACRADTPAERAALPLLRSVAVDHDAAVVLVLHNQASQQHYSVGGDVLQACDVIVRLDRVTEPKPAIRLSVDGKNRHGPSDEFAMLEHTDRGLREVMGTR